MHNHAKNNNSASPCLLMHIWALHIYAYPKASPLPPAPPAISCLTICSSIDWKMQIGRIEIIGKFSNCKYICKQISFLLFHRFIDFLRSWGTIFQAFWVLWHKFFTILVTIGCKDALRWDQNWFSVIFDGFWVPLETILDHFFIFSLIWAVQNHIWIAVTFFADFWMEFLVNSDVLTLHKYCKYWCFH